MKKTLILLILLFSFAFSEQIMTIKSSGVVSHIVAGKEYCYAVSLGSIITEEVNLFEGHLLPKKFYSWMHSSSFRGVGLRASMHYASFVSSKSAVPGMTRRELNYRVYNVSAVGISCTPPEPDCKNGEIKINGKCYPPCPLSTRLVNMPECACPKNSKSYITIDKEYRPYYTCEPTSDPPPEPCTNGLVFNFYGKCVSPDAPYFPVKPNNPKNPDNNNSNPNGSGNGNINPNNPDTNNSNPSNPNNPNGSGNGNLLPELKTQTSILRTINQNLANFNKGGGDGGGSTSRYPLETKKVTDNANKNASDIVKAINGIDSTTNMSGVEEKLDELIGKSGTSTDVDTVGIADLLVDTNGSLPTLDDDKNSSIPTYDDIAKASLSVYSDFEKDSISSLSALVGSIDYGIVNIFKIPTYDFVDYSISVPLPMTSKKLEGNLMSADFLNSLDFSLGKLALLLSTLFYSVYYVINRLF